MNAGCGPWRPRYATWQGPVTEASDADGTPGPGPEEEGPGARGGARGGAEGGRPAWTLNFGGPPQPPLIPDTDFTAEAVMDAVRSGDLDFLSAALDAGLSPDYTDDRGFALLMLAAYSGQPEAVALLLERGALVDGPPSEAGNTPLLGALFKGHEGAGQLLLDAGADPSVRGTGGLTPLLLASTFGHLQMVRGLLARGADFTVPGGDGRTPRRVAEDNHHHEIARLLAEAEAGAAPDG